MNNETNMPLETPETEREAGASENQAPQTGFRDVIAERLAAKQASRPAFTRPEPKEEPTEDDGPTMVESLAKEAEREEFLAEAVGGAPITPDFVESRAPEVEEEIERSTEQLEASAPPVIRLARDNRPPLTPEQEAQREERRSQRDRQREKQRERRGERGDRPERSERPEGGRPERAERPERGDRPERAAIAPNGKRARKEDRIAHRKNGRAIALSATERTADAANWISRAQSADPPPRRQMQILFHVPKRLPHGSAFPL
jgi:hypothetical protein